MSGSPDPQQKGAPAAPPVFGLDAAAAAQTLAGGRAVFAGPWPLAYAAAVACEHGSRALGTYYLGRATTDLAAGHDPTAHVAAFAWLTFCVPALPAAVAKLALTQWRHGALARYDAAFCAYHLARPRLWALSQGADAVKPRRTFLFAEQLRWAVDNVVVVAAELGGLAMQAAVQGAAVAAGLAPGVAVGLALGASGAVWLAWGRRDADMARHMQGKEARAELSAHRERFWDNVTLGNTNHVARWTDGYRLRLARWRDATVGRADDGVRATWASTLVGAVPTLATLAHHVRGQTAARAATAVAVDVLPQLPQLLSALETAAQLGVRAAGHGNAMHTNLTLALAEARRLPGLDLEAHLDADRLRIARVAPSHGSLSWPALQALAARGTSGYVRIEAPNGTGKSMALLLLKEQLGAAAALLPARHTLASPGVVGSEGERAHAALEALWAAGPRVLLLDEPAAHLDASARRRLRARLASPGERLVVEASPVSED